MQRIGLISDTHGLLRPEAEAFLRGCSHIVHGGDIGNAAILEALAALAPLTAVRGNNDIGAWAEALPEATALQVEGVLIHVLHDRAQLKVLAPPDGARVVVCGHSHKPAVEENAGLLFVNPGSAGPRRFKLPVAVGELLISGDSVEARIVELAVTPAR